MFNLSVFGQNISTLPAPLLLPTSVAFDAQGNLYVAETNGHVIRRVDTAGVLTTVAGNGTQGFSGDGGPPLAAELDSPTGIAVDDAKNLYIADSHNHRIRRVDGVTGTISTIAGDGRARFSGDGGPAALASLNLPSALVVDTHGNLYITDTNNHRIREVVAGTGAIETVAGNGVQQFAGDGGPATAASIDSPSGLAVDAAGNLYLADTHNQRVRRVDQATGVISTLAGTGAYGFSGDGGSAASAALALPHGVSVDAAGDVYVADSNNQRIRRIAADGTMTTLAGDGIQAQSGDSGQAAAVGLDTPRSAMLSAANVLAIADTGNGRIRQVSVGDTGTGSTVPGTLTLTTPSSVLYGTGSFIAALSGSLATGSVTFFDDTALGANALGSVALINNVATFSAASLPVGEHHLYGIYSGDSTHASARSATNTVLVSAVQLAASVASASMLYGQTLPILKGTLQGVLAQDAGDVSLVLGAFVSPLSPAGTYPIMGTLIGPAAANYTLAPLGSATLTINKAPSIVALSASSWSATVGQPVSVTLHVTSTTSGTPTGSVILLDRGVPLASLPISFTGSADFTSSTLALGSHALTASYVGDQNFTGGTATAQMLSVVAAATGDFVLTATGQTAQTVSSGSTASFTFTAQVQGTAALNSPITLSASGMPSAMTATFNPTYLPPGGAVTAFTLTIQTTKTVASSRSRRQLMSFAGLTVLLLPFAFLRRRRWPGLLGLLLVLVTVGCGDRVFSKGDSSPSVTSYPITVTGTATGPSGAVLQHMAIVTLNVQGS